MTLLEEIEGEVAANGPRWLAYVIADKWPRIKAALEAGEMMARQLEGSHGRKVATWSPHCKMCVAVDRFRAAMRGESTCPK